MATSVVPLGIPGDLYLATLTAFTARKRMISVSLSMLAHELLVNVFLSFKKEVAIESKEQIRILGNIFTNITRKNDSNFLMFPEINKKIIIYRYEMTSHEGRSGLAPELQCVATILFSRTMKMFVGLLLIWFAKRTCGESWRNLLSFLQRSFATL